MKIKVTADISFSMGRRTFLLMVISTNIINVTLLLVVLIQASACVLRLNVEQFAFLKAFGPTARACENLGSCCRCDIASAKYSCAKALKEIE